MSLLSERPHRRFNPLRGDWVLVSPHRTLRPWSGQKEAKEEEKRDNSQNPLSPGSKRANGSQNPEYTSTFVFTNDFPALLTSDEAISGLEDESGLFRAEEARGLCRVMCFHPDPKMTLALMEVDSIEKVVDEWIGQMQELGEKFAWVQIFENRGRMMGCSNPHPHCQIWASDFMPNEVAIKDNNLRRYMEERKVNLLMEYARLELQKKERIVAINENWVAMVPFWATWPFETLLVPHKRHVARLIDLNEEERRDLAKMLNLVTIKYDNVFQTDFPYTMGLQGAPTGPRLAEKAEHWQLHVHFLPPLLRSATVKKFMVGYEMLANVQRDITPETAANIIESQSNLHYSRRN